VARGWTTLMLVLARERRHDEALALRTAAEAAIERAGHQPALECPLAQAVGNVYRLQERLDDAIAELRRAVTVCEQAFGADAEEVIAPLASLVKAYLKAGRHEESLAATERLVGTSRALFGPAHPKFANALRIAGDANWFASRSDEADRLFQQAQAILEPIVDSNRAQLEEIYNNRGALRLTREHYAEALPFLERALALVQAYAGPSSVEAAGTEQNLGELEAVLGKLASARRRLEHAYAVRQAALPADHEDIAESLWALALVDMQEDKLDDAVARAQRAVAIFEQHPAGHITSALDVLGDALSRQGRAAEAVPVLERALRVREERYGRDGSLTGTALMHLGEAYLELHQDRKALPLLERAVEIRAAVDGDPVETGEAELDLARALSGASDRRRARALAAAARDRFVHAGDRAAKWRAKAEVWLASH
jgi:eukaryotic-like serine/threonine-protein kinase